MKKAWCGFWDWSRRQGGGFDYSGSCSGTPIILGLLSDRVWGIWLHLPNDSPWSHYLRDSWSLCLGVIGVWWIQQGRIKRRLLDTGHSRWWTIPLLFIMMAFVACPPRFGGPRAFLVAAFIVPQFPLFLDRRTGYAEPLDGAVVGAHDDHR
jgi:hypothetical protein